METQVDIQEIIRRLMAGQPVDNWSVLHDGMGGENFASTATYSDPSRDWVKTYDTTTGDLQSEGADHSGMSALQAAGLFAGLVGGGIGLESLFGGGGASLGGADAVASSLGGGGFDAAAGAFNPGFDALGFGSGAGSLGMGGLGEAATAFGLDPMSLGGIAAGGAGAASGGGFLDKLGTFASDPMNLLKTVGTVGGLYEALKGGNEGDFTQTSTKTLDPRIDSALFGADGKGGLLGQAQAWAAANPTGQNQTMRDAQSGLRGLLTDPRVMQGYMTQGGTGMGLMGRGVATNPWLTPKVGG